MTAEEREQSIVAEYLDALRVLWCHVPNEGADRRIVARRVKLCRLGLKPGVPDLLVFDSPPRRPESCGTAIELKATKRGRTSAKQKSWLEALSARGWSCHVAYGASDAITTLRSLGYGG